MFRISSRCEGIRRLILHDINLWHGQARLVHQLSNDLVELRSLSLGDLMGPIHSKNDLIAKPVGEKIHQGRKDEGSHSPALSSDRGSDEDENNRQNQHQKKSLELIHTNLPLFTVKSI